MSSHAANARGLDASAFFKSAGASCTTPLEIFFCDIDKLSFRKLHWREDLLLSEGCGSFSHDDVRAAQTKTREIKSNTSELVSQAFDGVAVLKRPERHAVQEKEHWTAAFVDIVDLIYFDLCKVAGEWELLLIKPRRRPAGYCGT